MAERFSPGDYLIFQLESGFGLLRLIDVQPGAKSPVWHLMAYEEFFPDPETAEQAIVHPEALHIRRAHMALTDRAFERTPAARVGNRSITDAERAAYQEWINAHGTVSDRSALLMLGIR